MKLLKEFIETCIYFIVIVFFVCIVSGILYGTYILLTSHDSDWIGFWGAIAGGALTLVGVWLTIKYEKDERKKDRKLEYRPFIYSEDGEIIKGSIETDANNIENVKFGFYVYNKGRAEACSVIVKPEKRNITQSNHDECITIARDEKKYIEFNICLKDFDKDITSSTNGIQFTVECIGIFEDNLSNEFTKIIRLGTNKEKKDLNILQLPFLKQK